MTCCASRGSSIRPPAEVYASLLDEGIYHCSIRTMYRILHAHGDVKERRRQLRHPVYAKPELIAEGPNQVWSWDISKLMAPAKWTYFYLYVIIDIFSRRVVAWCVADTESAALFKPLFEDAAAKHDVPPGQLTLHADRGPAMKAKATALLLADGRTFSRGRDLFAWLGLVPRQATTGGKPKLLGITKRGSKYLRKLLIQGARAAMPSLARMSTPLGAWLRGLLARAHANTVVVALASKLARIAWALLRSETGFIAGGPAAA